MKTLSHNQKLIVTLTSVLTVILSVIYFTDNEISHNIKNYMANNETAASIIYSAFIVLGVNLLIFTIGIISRKSSVKHDIIRKVYRRSRAHRRRKIETRQFDVLSQYR